MLAIDPLRAVVLDLDGTLLDTLDDIRIALNRGIAPLGRAALSLDEVRERVGDGAKVLTARALGLEVDHPDVVAAHARFLDAYAEDPVPATRVMPGAFALLDALEARAVPAIVCTNKSRRIAEVVVARVLGSRVQGLVAGGDTAALKPDASMVIAALKLAGAQPHEAVMIGDGTQDIRAARAAGVACIGFHGGYGRADRMRASPPDAFIDRLDEAIGLLGL